MDAGHSTDAKDAQIDHDVAKLPLVRIKQDKSSTTKDLTSRAVFWVPQICTLIAIFIVLSIEII